jgi:hypothetical protein
MPRLRAQEGQASVELVALLPLLALVAALLWQAVVAGQAVWLAGTAARAAARAEAVGADAPAAARRVLTSRLGRSARVTAARDGSVTVRIRIPAVIGPDRSLGSFSTQARFAAQDG